MRPTPETCFHLTVEIVLEIHAGVITRFGGSPGIRDRALLESAVAAPQASWSGQSTYADVVEIAAAYLFFLCRNHPFVDGNKRAAFGACLVFLRLNHRSPQPDGPEWEDLVLSVATGHLDREQTTRRLRTLVD
jgi:death-on-curing protein